MKSFYIFFFIIGLTTMIAQNKLHELLFNQEGDFLNIVKNSDKYKLQIIYTKIDRDEQNKPKFTDYSFNLDKDKYFYPASSVKFPTALIALEKLNEIKIQGLNKYSKLEIDSCYNGQSAAKTDSSSSDHLPSIAHYIKKIFLVSDNDAFNRIYEFCGQEYLNKRLWQKGYNNLRIIHRLSVALNDEENKYTNPFKFYDNNGVLYSQECNYSTLNINNKFTFDNTLLGRGFINNGKLINEPMDFSKKNFISLETYINILKALMFPDAVEKKYKFNLTKDDYEFLYKYMSMKPSESKFPKYDSTHYDSYVKFFMFGDSKEPMPKNIRIFNKVGLAYGFLTDVAYIVDFDKNIEFFLAATMQVNENQIYNDNNYEYENVGLPFLAKLGNIIYNYELSRERKVKPDLSKFEVNYTD